MATINQLLQQPGPFIAALLPDFQELVRQENPYLNVQAAAALYQKMKLWGGPELLAGDINAYPPPPKYTPGVHDEFANGGQHQLITRKEFGATRVSKFKAYEFNSAQTAFINNFIYKLNNFDMAAVNAYLDFVKAIHLFEKMVDYRSYFINNPDLLDQVRSGAFPCPPPEGKLCWDLAGNSNAYLEATSAYQRPRTTEGTEGTGFGVELVEPGDVGTKAVVVVDYRFDSFAPWIPCPPPEGKVCHDLSYLAGRYVAFQYDAATDSYDVVWLEVDGIGAQPTFNAGGTVNYLKVEIARTDEWNIIQDGFTQVLVGSGHWVVDDACPPLPPTDPLCTGMFVTRYEADVVGDRSKTADGRGGYAQLETDMYATDGTLLASGVVTDQQWVDTHNSVKRVYELNELGIDMHYLTLIDTPELKAVNALGASGGDDPCKNGSGPGCPCCDGPGSPNPCIPCTVIIQTPWEADIYKIPVNTPGYTGDNRGKRDRVRVWK